MAEAAAPSFAPCRHPHLKSFDAVLLYIETFWTIILLFFGLRGALNVLSK